MAGGTFTAGERKIRPGMYARFISEQQQLLGLSPKGTVIMPLLNWDYGPSKEFFEVNVDDIDGAYSKIGYHITDDNNQALREIFKSALKVILYNPAAGTKASITSGSLTTTAKYPGTLGNKLKLVIKDSLTTNKLVQLYMCPTSTEEELLYQQDDVTNVEDLIENEWVNFTGTGTLSDDAGTNLSGGATTNATESDVQDFLDDAETQEFNIMFFPSTNATQIGYFDNKIKYFIKNVGKQIQGVRPWANTNADYEYISQVENGVKLQDGTSLTVTQAAAWFAGASAASQPYESLTYVNYPQAIEPSPRLKHSEVIESLKGGRIVFTFQNGNTVVEQDINSLTTITKDLDESYKKNRVIRTQMEVQKLAQVVLQPNKYNNNADGVASVIEAINTQILLTLQALNALKNVDTDADVIVDMSKTKGDEFYADVHIQPVDSIEKFYVTVKTSY